MTRTLNSRFVLEESVGGCWTKVKPAGVCAPLSAAYVTPLLVTQWRPLRINFPDLFFNYDKPDYDVASRRFTYNNRPWPYGTMRFRLLDNIVVLPSCTSHISMTLIINELTSVISRRYMYKKIPRGEVGTLKGALIELCFLLGR
jgi:hypothetical protein